MVRKVRNRVERRYKNSQRGQRHATHAAMLLETLDWFLAGKELFTKDRFHGNIKWKPDQLASQAILWSWQDSKNVTDAFERAKEVCEDLKLENVAKCYTTFVNALDRYRDVYSSRIRCRYQTLAEEIGGRFWRSGKWVLIGFDGSRVTAPRSISNERAICAANYGKGKTAKYRKKKTKGMRRKRNEKNKPYPQAPQCWITMMWHMSLRLPWTWRLGPSNSSERGHVTEMLQREKFPENTMFCGDAGFVGYPLWSTIIDCGQSFLVRVGANAHLLSEHANIKKMGGGIVLCWPKDKMNSGCKPLRLRLVKVKVGSTKMWMLTNVLSVRQLSMKQIIKFYRMRWGIEVEFRGLKQTLDKHDLRCRKSNRLMVELDWSVRAMGLAELAALREQIPDENNEEAKKKYDPKDRSLANTMRCLRRCMRKLCKRADPDQALRAELALAVVQRYNNHTDKKARYRPKNPDKKPLGDPKIRKLTTQELRRLREYGALAA
jgi:hypothetical protein